MTVRRWLVAGLVVLAAVAGCSAPAPGAVVPTASTDPVCAAFAPNGELDGRAISVLVPGDARAFAAAAEPFETCTGATLLFEGGAGSVEPQLRARLAGGDPPDIAHLPGPGLLASLVATQGPAGRAAVPAPPPVTVNVDQYLPEVYARAGSVGGTLYAVPLEARIVSWVRYSPREFTDRELTVPVTWDELVELVETAEEPALCPGGPGAQVLQDALLREAGPDVHDGWLEHTLDADDERAVAALESAEVLREPEFVAAPGASLLDGDCLLQYPAGDEPVWPAGTEVGPDGDVFAFPLPAAEPGAGTPVLVTGSFAAAFDDRPEVAAYLAYLASPEWAGAMARATGGVAWSSAHAGLDPTLLEDPLARRTAEILRDPATEVRFAAGELLPPPVAGALTDAVAEWADGADAADALAGVEAAWPG